VDGRALNFRLAGINNQNFIMRDEETGSWWQQVSGECILGPLKGRRLVMFEHDELTFAQWRRERPAARVLRPDPRIEAAGEYAPADWEQQVARMPVATTLDDGGGGALEPRTLVVGLTTPDGAAKAYPLEALRRQSPVIDKVGATPVLVLLNEDGKSVRAFERTVEGRALEFFLKPGAAPLRVVDSETGSEWDFTGACVAGPLAGRQLKKIFVLKDYWFDWKTYQPDTAVYLLGDR
jgi:Protein of unknown function (DUF3179)